MKFGSYATTSKLNSLISSKCSEATKTLSSMDLHHQLLMSLVHSGAIESARQHLRQFELELLKR